ncbi:UDP-glucose 4-epimerase [Paenibacillus sp. JGP012]|uniref:NAD-dependent epimerase/dehydratase family protein n=1 Tax=Paenibacillus sp. JGP012 TaxID=2735914 RepID=UPI001613F44D|nr:NAD-dependent epimerase/dehydratase family protein [Paenibacillus sp. JGP012]MBB6024672.1 UDP-glucose 4-epimerase [Paenibacillus sp. JGP012]
MNILVTGGAGFIGSHIVDGLIELGHEVLIIDNLSTGNIDNVNPKAEFYEMDLFDNYFEYVYQKFRPDIVYHLAAQVSVQKSLSNPLDDAKLNILGSIRLLELCTQNNTRKIIYPSSAAIYGDPLYLPIDENHNKVGESYYGLSKYFPEQYIELFSSKQNIDYTILRYSNVFGSRQNHQGEGGVVSIFCNNFENSRPSTIYGDGEQTRDFIYVKDVVSANMNCLYTGSKGTYNISSNRETSINELHRIFNMKFGSSMEPIYKMEKPGEIKHSTLDNTLAYKELDWCPKYSVEQGIEEMITKKHKKII